MTLQLVTADDCHFCARAREILDRLDVRAQELELHSPEADALVANAIPLTFLPVLTDGERVVAYGRFSEKRLRKELGL